MSHAHLLSCYFSQNVLILYSKYTVSKQYHFSKNWAKCPQKMQGFGVLVCCNKAGKPRNSWVIRNGGLGQGGRNIVKRGFKRSGQDDPLQGRRSCLRFFRSPKYGSFFWSFGNGDPEYLGESSKVDFPNGEEAWWFVYKSLKDRVVGLLPNCLNGL